MEKVRIGNDIEVKYTVLRDGQPETFVGATDIVVNVKNEAYGKIIPSTFNIIGNIVNIVLDAADCVLCGKHRVILSYKRGNDITIDSPAFELVQFTSLTGGTEIVGVEIVTVNISGDIGIAIPDNNKIDLDGLNSNIDKLHFKPDTLVALADVGDVRYSAESKTLEVKVSDTVSIQLGQEMQTRVKNDAGVQIDNGQLVYINSAAGANPLAKIASTTDANIAQRTFGMATENIASNGFGAITTEGLVRDVNTAAFTEGDMLWLGVNGTVTNIEPVAPTPKISVGMVLRSNVTNGVIYVKIRAIARNQKLSDVYAPTLTGGDILRWNSTTLRFETFNVTTALAGKADLVGGKIPTSQLPSYVDDVLEYANLAAFPASGEAGKIYVALDTNLTYRWSGSTYVEISKSLALGETSSTAYRGDRGKIAYDHSQATGNAHGTTASQIPNAPAGTIAATNVQAAINELDADNVQLETDLNANIDQVRADLNILNNVNTLYPSVPIYNRVIADSGLVRSKKSLNSLTQFLLDLRDNTKLLFCPELGVKLRTSGVNNYVTKMYDISPVLNDGTQTTALNQPFLSGNIAPNEKYSLKNPNNVVSYMTHTTISFASTDKWTVTTMLNDFCSAFADSGSYCGNGTAASNIYTRKTSQNRVRFLSNTSIEYLFNVNNSLIGKNSLLTLTALGNGTLNLFINGTLFQSITGTDTSFIFSRLVNSYSTFGLYGAINYHAIRNIALSPTQVADEYTYLRTLFPEIESVQIGTQTLTSSNCEMTCTPMGNVISEMQAAANVEKVVNGGFDSTANWTVQAGWDISGGKANCSNSTGYIAQFGVVSLGKLYKVTYTISNYVSGSVRAIISSGVNGSLRNLNGTYSEYLKATADGTLIITSLNFVGSIDNASVQEVGWSDSTNLYNAIYAQTTGTSEQKEYAAVKAAAMWRNANNDPILSAIYGKKFNKYARRLLAMDIAYYNAANPTALWGWDIPTRAQLTTLAANGGNALKVAGSNYWNTANGNNATGFSLLGGGYIDANGVYVNNKAAEGVWCKDADFARIALDGDNTFNEVAATTEGYSIRLIKV